MSLQKKIFKQTSFYLIGEVLVLVGGFISFPIFTRLLSREAYGVMSLIGITLMLSETVFSGGLRHSVQRFYGESRESAQDSIFFTTSFIGALILSLLKNICSVLQRPIPSVPNFRATSESFGVSAFALTPIFL